MSGYVNTNGYLREKCPSDPGYYEGDYPYPQRPTFADDAMTNIQMSDAHREHREAEQLAELISNFDPDSFLEGLKTWEPL